MTSSVFLPESVNEVVSFPPSTESILQAIAAIAWQSLPPVAMPAASWLQERSSLTARLRRQSGAFALHCLQEAVTADAGLRQVLLSVDGVAWIWGLTQIDAALLQACPELSQLGQQPLGEWLFAHPELQRGALEYADLAVSAFWRAAMVALGQPVGHALWARRCRWQLDNGSLSVMELFLPAAPLYAGTEEQSEQE